MVAVAWVVFHKRGRVEALVAWDSRLEEVGAALVNRLELALPSLEER